jgi:hypothetical protein
LSADADRAGFGAEVVAPHQRSARQWPVLAFADVRLIAAAQRNRIDPKRRRARPSHTRARKCHSPRRGHACRSGVEGFILTGVRVRWHLHLAEKWLNATAGTAWVIPSYVFATPILGDQAAISLTGIFGRTNTSVAGALTGALATPFGTAPFMRSDSISDSLTGFGDLYPQVSLRWSNRVHNYMTYWAQHGENSQCGT